MPDEEKNMTDEMQDSGGGADKRSIPAELASRLSPEAWGKMSTQDRVGTLQAVENHEAQAANRPAATISTNPDWSPGHRGSYSRSTNGITLNHDMVANSTTSNQPLSTTLHEGFHSYQNDVCANPGQHPEVPAETAAAWQNNADNYITPSADYAGYRGQPLEASARDYAASRSAEYQTAISQAEAAAAAQNNGQGSGQGNGQGGGQGNGQGSGQGDSQGGGQSGGGPGDDGGGPSNDDGEGMGP